MTERFAPGHEIAPLIPIMIGGLRAAQVAVKVAPHIHSGIKNVAPYVAVGGAVQRWFT